MRECPALQKSLDWCDGVPQYPGIRRRIYSCNKNLIAKWPTLPRDNYGRPTSAKYVGDFELVADAKWQYVDINPDKSKLTSEPQGEAPSQTQLNKLELLHNGVDDEATLAAGYLNNSDTVYIVVTSGLSATRSGPPRPPRARITARAPALPAPPSMWR